LRFSKTLISPNIMFFGDFFHSILCFGDFQLPQLKSLLRSTKINNFSTDRSTQTGQLTKALLFALAPPADRVKRKWSLRNAEQISIRHFGNEPCYGIGGAVLSGIGGAKHAGYTMTSELCTDMNLFPTDTAPYRVTVNARLALGHCVGLVSGRVTIIFLSSLEYID
jgi:hypothetical protein